MVAAKDFTHDGECYAAGECFQAEAIHAAALKYQGKALFARQALVDGIQVRRDNRDEPWHRFRAHV